MTPNRRLLAIAHRSVDRATEIVLSRDPGWVLSKGDRDMATEVDYSIEQTLRSFLASETSNIGFLGEEEGHSGPTEQYWVLDPIDGTVNFLHGSPLFAISLGLVVDGEPLLGVIHLPLMNRRYVAMSEEGATLNGKPLRVSDTNSITQAVVAFGDFAVGARAIDKNRSRILLAQEFASKAQRVRMHGSAAIDLAWLAEGAVDATVLLSNKPWDTAAGIAIAREAGASIVDLDGSRHSTSSKATIGCNAALLPELLSIISSVGDLA